MKVCDPTCDSHQTRLPRGLSRQEYWSGLPLPSPGELPSPGLRTAGGFFSSRAAGKPAADGPSAALPCLTARGAAALGAACGSDRGGWLAASVGESEIREMGLREIAATPSELGRLNECRGQCLVLSTNLRRTVNLAPNCARASTRMGTPSAEARVWPQPPAGLRTPRGKQPALRREGALTRRVPLAVHAFPLWGSGRGGGHV